MPTKFERLTPMLNVADAPATVAWYQSLGFEVLSTDREHQGGDTFYWAYLQRGEAEIMINQRPGSEHASRGADLYITVDDVDALYADLKGRVKVTEEVVDQFYGMRDFWIEDPNGYILGFGQKIPDASDSST